MSKHTVTQLEKFEYKPMQPAPREVPLLAAFDDDSFFLQGLRALCEGDELATVETFEDPDLGLQWLADTESRVDAVLCDLDMPGTNGMGVFKELQSIGYQGSVIPMSGHTSAMLESLAYFGRCHGLHVVTPIQKPITREQLVDRLDTMSGMKLQSSNLGVYTLEEIREAFELMQFYHEFQPIVSADDEKLAALEALVRWEHPELGTLLPDQFLPAIRQFGFVRELNEVTIQNATKALSALRLTNPDLQLFVNLMESEAGLDGLVEMAVACAQRHGVSPTQLVFEVTEDSLALDTPNYLEALMQARLAGIQLALDDFGKRYTSFEWFEAIPFTHVKVDRNILKKALNSKAYQAQFEAITGYAKDVGLNYIAEGVENRAGFNLARQQGCSHLQGWLFGAAAPLHELSIGAD